MGMPAADPGSANESIDRSSCGLDRIFAAAILLVDRGPGDALGIVPRASLLALAVLDMRRLALLLVGIGGFVAAWHGHAPDGRSELGPRAVVIG